MRHQPHHVESRRPDDGLSTTGHNSVVSILGRHTQRMKQLHRGAIDRPVCLALQTDNGTITLVELHINKDRVYIWQEDDFLVTFNSTMLYRWLTTPNIERPIASPAVSFAFTPETGITLTVPGTDAAAISSASLAELRHRLQP